MNYLFVYSFSALILLTTLIIQCSSALCEHFLPKTTFSSEAIEFYSDGHVSALTVQAMDPLGIVAVRCYFRFAENMPYLFIDLKPFSDGHYRGIFPQLAEEVEEIEYFFLIVNKKRQVIKTGLFFQPRLSNIQSENQKSFPSILKTELQSIPFSINEFFQDTTIIIERIDLEIAYGYIAGVYQVQDMPEMHTFEGYYGGFILKKDNSYLSVSGLLIGAPEQSNPYESFLSDKQSAENVLGPDIRGENWSGFFHIYPINTMHQEITAVVTQNAFGYVTIATSKASGIGRFFHGEINETGDLTLYDLYDNETWTSFYGPVNSSQIIIADWVDKSFQELYQIFLERDDIPEITKDNKILHLFMQGVLQSIIRTHVE